jgi:hypothetical protein
VAAVTAVRATLHFADLVIRGQLVLDRGLDPGWNHSGWPFQPRFSPFTASLIVTYGLLLGGIMLPCRQQVWTGYWLATAILLSGIVTQVHFGPSPNTESPSVIVDTYGNSRRRDHGGDHHLRHRRHPRRDGRPGHLGPPRLWTLVTADATSAVAIWSGADPTTARAPVGCCSSAPPAALD